MKHKKTILFVTEMEFVPPIGGTPIRSFNFVDSMLCHYDVVVIAPEPKESVRQLHREPLAWIPIGVPPFRGYVQTFVDMFRPNKHIKDLIEEASQRFRPDVVWFDCKHWGQYVPLVDVPTVMGTHNAQSFWTEQSVRALPSRVGRWRRLAWVWAEKGHEQRFFSRFDAVVSVSEEDRRFHAKIVGGEKSALIPNYINEAWYEEERVERDAHTVVMTANFHAYPNFVGAKWLIEEVWPAVSQKMPNATLEIVGFGSELLADVAEIQKNIVIRGKVPSIVPYLKRAAVSVVPLFQGSGTRFKILESFVCETPVVSTTLGAEGLNVTDGREILIGDDVEAFTTHVLALLEDSGGMPEKAFAFVTQTYGFDINTERIHALIESLLETDA